MDAAYELFPFLSSARKDSVVGFPCSTLGKLYRFGK